VPFVLRHIRQQIQSNGEFQIGWVEINQVICPPAGDMVQQFLGQVSMRVNQPDTVTTRDVLNNHVPQQGRLSRTRLADDIDVLTQIGQLNAEGNWFSPAIAGADLDGVIVHGC
jgi:hypothetical protein